MRDKLFELARRIQPHFKRFYLAGGTALMFRYNHRLNEDLYFLSPHAFFLSFEDYPELPDWARETLKNWAEE